MRISRAHRPLQAQVRLRLLAARFFFDFVVLGNLLQVVGLENLTAIHAVDVIDPSPAHQEFRTIMLTAWHSKLDYPYFSRARNLVKPPVGLGSQPHSPDRIRESP